MRLYATTTDVWPTDAPADADALVRAASRVVDVLLRGVVYDTDVAGMPTDTDVAASLKAAATAIALEAEATGTLAAGGTQKWETVAIGSVQLSSLQGASVSDTPTVGGLPVPPAAVLELSSVGRVEVWTR